MKKIFIALIVSLLFVQVIPVFAISTDGAWQDWKQAQQERIGTEVGYRTAYKAYNDNKTPGNEQEAVATGKDLLNAWLDEAQTWLIWKNQQAKENPDVPTQLKNDINSDVNKNLDKIEDLRGDVENVHTLPQGVGVFIKMIASYGGLVVDVGRNTGAAWVVIGNKLLDTASDYEAKLRATAEDLDDNQQIISALDIAKSLLNSARSKVNQAEAVYKQVVTPGQPIIKFNEANGYLTQARQNLLSAQAQLFVAFNLINSK